jgi:hypothetical protein
MKIWRRDEFDFSPDVLCCHPTISCFANGVPLAIKKVHSNQREQLAELDVRNLKVFSKQEDVRATIAQIPFTKYGFVVTAT